MAEAPAATESDSKSAEKGDSPAMRQYRQFKERHPEHVLFFRMGDFYEMFWEDARLAARVLGVTLTSRSRGGLEAADAIPMAGVPYHAVEGYLRKMIAAGHKVALCEQMEDPKQAKGVVRREVVRLMTPGTLTDDPLLEGSRDNFLAAVAFGVGRTGGYQAGLAWVELSTGNFRAFSGHEQQVLDELSRIAAAEVLIPEMPSGQPHPISSKIQALGINALTHRPGWEFAEHHARQQLQRQWQVRSAEGFGFAEDDAGVLAAGAILSYLAETQKAALPHLRPLRKHETDDFLSIDSGSWRSLEIDRTVRSGGTEGSLLHSIDRTRCGMGGRMLRQWLRFPLRDGEHITARQDAIAALLQQPQALTAIAAGFENVCDIERILARVSVGRANPRDLSALARCLSSLPKLHQQLETMDSKVVGADLLGMREFVADRSAYLQSAIDPEPAPHLREGGVIAAGFDAELDRLRGLGNQAQQWLADYQAKLSAQTGIPSLKIAYNKVFGYYIEVTDMHRAKVAPDWTRKQTVKNAERYITPELKQFESDALGAREKAIALEVRLFEDIRQALLPHVGQLQELADALARLDVLASLAILARERRYCRPTISDGRQLEIRDGRHPVLDQQLGNEFVANDVRFGPDDTLMLITGPNMAGKSTYIRQTALIVLLAQIGSYVPAKEAAIGLADRLFTRIGASDELHAGQSTFMVEMTETANILNNATDRSLVILDEIGRGTSTLDGLSLAWAIAEHLAANLRPRALFATHYHELTELAERFNGVRNLNVAVREWEDQVIFLHRIVEGGTDRSYGIHVARLAGVPKSVLDRARQLLGELAVHHAASRPRLKHRKDDSQMQLFAEPKDELREAMKQLDLNHLSPMEAFEFLKKWKSS
jgi:DNA mismatch repair protein MutS